MTRAQYIALCIIDGCNSIGRQIQDVRGHLKLAFHPQFYGLLSQSA